MLDRRVFPLAGLVSIVVATVFLAPLAAGPVVNGWQVKQFLGGRDGKMVYTKLDKNSDNKNGRSLWYLDFSESSLTEHKILDTYNEEGEPRNEVISPDGEWVAFNILNTQGWHQSQLYVCRFKENATKIHYGQGALPHWWNKPGTDEWYLVYNDRDLENNGWQMSWPPTSGETWCRQVNMTSGYPVGDARKLNSLYINGGRSVSGRWLFAAGGFPGTFRLQSATSTSNADIAESIYFGNNTGQKETDIDGCNPSISPHPSDNDVRVMYLDDPHLGVFVCDVRNNNRRYIEWKDSENPYLDEPEWSTGEDFATGKASAGFVEPPFDLYLMRVTDGATLKVMDGNYSFPHLWLAPEEVGVRPGRADRVGIADQAPGAHPAVLYDMRGRAIEDYRSSPRHLPASVRAAGVRAIMSRRTGSGVTGVGVLLGR